MVKLSHSCNAPRVGEYFRLQLQSKDAPAGSFFAASSLLDAQWIGSALALVSLSPLEAPRRDHLVRLARGLHPQEDTRLAPAINRKRCFYDVVIATPKTVSVAALLQPDHPTARRVLKAHWLAVQRLTEDLGRWMIRGQFLSSPLAAGWLGMLCGHTHSRAGDPHLHHHCVVPNLMYSREKQWRALQVDFTGTNRLRLELLYGHALARELRRAGLGAELEMRTGGLPELRSLLPLARTFCRASENILQSSTAAEAERPASIDDEAAASEILPAYPAHPRRAALQRRQRLADATRPEKPPHADDPAALEREARRWCSQLPKEGLRALQQLLDRAMDAPSREFEADAPPLDKAFFRGVCRRLPEDCRETGPVLMQAAVCACAGRHTWEDLRAATRRFAADRKALRQKILDDFSERAAQRAWAKQVNVAPPVPAAAIPPAPPPPPSPPRRRGSGRCR